MTDSKPIRDFMAKWAEFAKFPNSAPSVIVQTDGKTVTIPEFPDVILSGPGIEEILKLANGETKSYVLDGIYPILDKMVSEEKGIITVDLKFQFQKRSELDGTKSET